MTGNVQKQVMGEMLHKIPAKMRPKKLGLCIHRMRNPFVKPFQKYISDNSLMDSTGKSSKSFSIMAYRFGRVLIQKRTAKQGHSKKKQWMAYWFHTSWEKVHWDRRGSPAVNYTRWKHPPVDAQAIANNLQRIWKHSMSTNKAQCH